MAERYCLQAVDAAILSSVLPRPEFMIMSGGGYFGALRGCSRYFFLLFLFVLISYSFVVFSPRTWCPCKPTAAYMSSRSSFSLFFSSGANQSGDLHAMCAVHWQISPPPKSQMNLLCDLLNSSNEENLTHSLEQFEKAVAKHSTHWLKWQATKPHHEIKAIMLHLTEQHSST